MLRSVQYLRALAATVVIVAHVGFGSGLLGQQGVDIFFVISGFIMMLVSQRESRPLMFLKARAARIAPLYWILTFVTAAITAPVPIAHLLLSLAFVPHIGPERMIWPVIPQGWTLLFEVFFYVVFAASLVLPKNRRLAWLTIFLGALSIIGAIWRSETPVGQTYVNPVMLEFLAGVWLHRLWSAGKLGNPWLGAGMLAVGAAWLAIVVLVLKIEPDHFFRCAVWGVPAALVVAGALSMEKVLPNWKTVLLLGDASYSTYLSHRLLIPPLRSLLHGVPHIPALVGIIGACSVVGIVLHFTVEKPIAALLKAKPRAPVPAAA